jgi:hypothetical protein
MGMIYGNHFDSDGCPYEQPEDNRSSFEIALFELSMLVARYYTKRRAAIAPIVYESQGDDELPF